MKDRLPGVVALILLAALVVGTWWAADYAIQSVEIDPPRRITHERDSWSTAFVMLRTNEHGFAINRLEGDAMDHFPDTDTYEVVNPWAVGHQPGSPMTEGYGDFGILYNKTDIIELNGNARLKRLPDAENKLLDVRSVQLMIDTNKDLVYTDKPALVINGNSTLRGKGMNYDNSSRQLTVKSASDVKISGQDQAERNQRKTEPNQ